ARRAGSRMDPMELMPDARWCHVIAGFSNDGDPEPISLDVLATLPDEWAALVLDLDPAGGPASLLRTARHVFVHSWFNYDFMAVACLLAFQAMEAALRGRYPGSPKAPLRSLVDRASRDGILSYDEVDLALGGVRLRNSLSHPSRQTAFTLGM